VQSRRDQLQAYKFLTRRALAALVVGEPDVPEAPMRRLSLTTLTGIMVAVLVTAGFAVFGLIRPGNNTKIETGTIYIERGTGAQFVLLDDGFLHPTLNYTSAVLAAGKNGQVGTKTVSSGALTHKQHSFTVGISGVPQSLPRSGGGLVRSPWSVCSQIKEQAASENRAEVTVTIGGIGGATPLQPNDGIIVSAPGAGQPEYLLWQGKRLKVAGDDISTALGLQSGNPLIIGSGLLNALPEGPVLQTPTIPGAGRDGPTVGGQHTVVGQLVQITDDNSFQVVLQDGLAPVRRVWAGLLRTMLIAGQLRDPIHTSLRNVLNPAVPKSNNPHAALQQFDGLPSDKPAFPDAPAQAGGACVIFHENAPLTLAVPQGTAPANGGEVLESPLAAQGVADQVNVPAEKAAVVASTSGAAGRYVIAAPGKKFSTSTAALGLLGYGSVTPVNVPSQLLLLIPKGPALDSDAARHEAIGS
jgi:type VII secretion protein EccB